LNNQQHKNQAYYTNLFKRSFSVGKIDINLVEQAFQEKYLDYFLATRDKGQVRTDIYTFSRAFLSMLTIQLDTPELELIYQGQFNHSSSFSKNPPIYFFVARPSLRPLQ